MNHFWTLQPMRSMLHMRLREKAGLIPGLLVLLTLSGVVSLRCSATSSPSPDRATQDESRVGPLDGRPGDVVALVFTSTDCPVANAMAPELGRSLSALESQGIRCYLVYPRTNLTGAAMRGHAEAYGLEAELLADPDQKLVAALGADITPQGYVLEFDADGDWHVRYRGRVNDLYASIGNRRDLATRHEWRDAALAVSEGFMPPSTDGPPAVGCLIEINR